MNGYGLRLVAWLGFGLGLCGWGQPSDTAVVPGGTGTETDPYQISELGHLAWMSNTATDSVGCHYTLSNDIDATATKDWDNGAGFTPIGTESVPFAGVFDGNGHVIRNLTINRPNTFYVGLFCVVDRTGELRNLGVVNGEVAGYRSASNLAGLNNGTIIRCYASGTVSNWGWGYVGGLVACNSGTITQCYSTGTVTGVVATSVGITGYPESTGGLVGTNSGTITQCYSTGIVTGYWRVGGLVGENNTGTIHQCYATGTVTGFGYVGGLIGENNNSIVTQCYAIGLVTGVENVGGLVGSGSDVSQSYWDVEATGQPISVPNSVGSSTAVMKQSATFAGWDWSVWGIIADGGSYPYLRWDPPPFRVQVLGTRPGTVTSEASMDGNTLAVTAIADEGAEFVHWEGCGIAAPAAASTAVFMDCHKRIQAVFRVVRNISSITELQKIGNDPDYLCNGHYWLTQDLEAAETATWNDGYGFTPIGTVAAPFTGVFDGNDHVISSLTINRPYWTGVGLFGVVGRGGEVRHLGMIDSEVTGDSQVGILAGRNDGAVTRCHANGIVTGYPYVGGPSGYGNTLTTTRSGFSSSTSSELTVIPLSWDIGGAVGSNTGTITQCYATSAVNGASSWHVGGLVGHNHGTVIQGYAAGAVTGSYYVGGLVGSNNGTVSQSYWDLETTGQTASSGGATGVGTTEMMQAATFVDWDWNAAWVIAENASYPYLRSNACMVTFNATGGTVTPACEAVIPGSPYGILPTPARPGYVFAGWWTGGAETELPFQVMADTVVATITDHTLYARYSPCENAFPTVITAAPTATGTATATCGGQVATDGSAAVTARGVCWSTTPNPTTANAKTNNGAGIGTFTCTLTGLREGTTYYACAYATSNAGTAYGKPLAFTTAITGPDFVVTNLVITPELPTAGGKFTITITVMNLDSKPGKGGSLQVWVDKPAVAAGGEKGNKATTISTLKPGQSRTVKVTLTAPDALGTFTLRAFIDAKNGVTETDETNNQATLNYRTGRPDFKIKAVSLSPASPAAGKTFTAYVTVANAGEVAGNAGTLDVWADCSTLATPPVPGGKTKGNKSKTLGTLQPGQEKTVAITGLKAPADTAAAVLGLLLDSRAKTPETDENNNWLDFEYQCQ